jgi:hypothetical protein
MYRKRNREQVSLDDFIPPFGGKLLADNRWVKLARVIPWDRIEDRYARRFGKCGNVAIPLRVALGALIIKEKCGFTDEETVQNISENNDMQSFVGYTEFRSGQPFAPSLMVEFRRRIDMAEIQKIIDEMDEENRKNDPPPEDGSNRGTLMIDATCAPADIRYPTDLGLLNEGREKLEAVIDALWGALEDKRGVKPRTYRQKARQAFLCVEKQRKHRTKTLRKAIGRQLRFLRRDLGIIAHLHDQGAFLECLTGKQMHDLHVISEVYRQRQEMYINRTHRTQERIVSIAQPHIRPIVRGKASAEVEFGAKIAVSRVNDCFRIETLNWNNFNEGTELITAIERYRARYGVYPQAVLADELYRNRANLAFCKAHGIRLSGPRLGRPGPAAKEDRQVARLDSAERNGIESPFGIGKRRYGLSRIMAKLRETAESVIAMQFLLLNLDCRVRALALRLLRRMQNAWDVLSRRWKLDGVGWICYC